MISVIIPTMWMADGFLERLQQLSAIDEVGEIILIDNSDNPPDLNIEKLKHIKEYKNIYVNPAWNKGASIAEYDNLCIMNDDINFDNKIFSLVEPHISEDKGMIGLYEFDGLPYYDEDKEFKIEDAQRWRGMGYACMFFIHKLSYLQIPNLSIWFGDDYLFHYSGKTNYVLKNVNVWGSPSRTSRHSIFDDVKVKDSIIFAEMQEIKSRMGN